MPIAAVRSTRLYRQIADQLQRLIREGEFPPGTNLPPERELAHLLGVSRASVREALIALEVIGDVEVRVGNGVRVIENDRSSNEGVMSRAAKSEPWRVDPEFAAEVATNPDEEIPPLALLQARQYVEPETAALAAANATSDDLDAIHAALQRNIEDNRGRDGGRFVGDRLLHIRIAEASKNPAYALLIRHMLGHSYGVMFRRLQKNYMEHEMWLHSQSDHERIVSAIDAGDSERARKEMLAHLTHVIDVFFLNQT